MFTISSSSLSEGALYALIVGCEAAFWVALLSGLVFRYVFQKRRTSLFLLWCVPLIDIFLLVFTVLDLRRGATATFAHGLATAYVGFTVAFGPLIIRWADMRFAHRFAGGPPPSKPPSSGWSGVLYELKLWGRCLLAVAIIYLLLFSVIAFVGQSEQTKTLEIWFRISFGTAILWFILGPIWRLIFFR